MKKNALTLIELLAVIAILALILTIGVPNLLNTITKSKKRANIISARDIIKIGRIYAMENGDFTEIDILANTLSYKGEKPEKGIVQTNEDGDTRVMFYKDGFCITKSYTETDVNVTETTIDNCLLR